MTVIEYKGDIFTTSAKIIAHGCNLTGVTGGIAGTIFSQHKNAKNAYLESLNKGISLGELSFAYEPDKRYYVANLITQKIGGANADIDAIEMALIALKNIMRGFGISTAAIPHIGAGIGGLEWEDVRKVIYRIFNESKSLTLEIWEYDKPPRY